MKLALVGCGPEGLAFAAAAQSLGVALAACADGSLAASRKAAALSGAPAKKDVAGVFKQQDLEAVVLGGSPAIRQTHLRQAIARGLHVLCPAPLARDAAAAKTMLTAARDAGVHLYVAHDSRVAPADIVLAQQLEARAAGRPGFVRIHRAERVATSARGGKRAQPGAGVIGELLARDFDWLTRQFGLAGTVFAQAATQSGLDHAALTITFPRGPIAQLIGTRAAHGLPDRASVEICGTGGMIQYSTDDPVFESTARAGRLDRASPIAPDLPARHLRLFLQRLEKSPTKAQFEHDLKVVQLTDAALRSARSGREQRP